jgi:poly-gamma-glutamate capsule biosynthesis protein CapA/YwtB (metallophosphatase superfamily)
MSNLPRSLTFFLLAVLAACSAGPEPISPSLDGIHPSPTVPTPATVTPSPTSTETPPPTATLTVTATASITPTITLSPEPSPVTLLAVGDIMMARTVGQRILEEGPGVVFANVQDFLSSADILAGNLECAITDQGQPEPKTYTFAAPPSSAQALGMAGFDIAVLGNNHSLDYGQDGLVETLNLLNEQGIGTVGVGVGDQAAGPIILEKNGLRIAFLSYVDVPREFLGFDTRAWLATDTAPGIAWAITEDIQADVTAAKQQADVVIVFMHFGYEGNEMPVRFQRDMAIVAIKAGASAVIGSHPHMLQHVEVYHGALIAYSLGNFVFDDFDMPENRSAILRLRLDQNGMLSYDWFPVVIINGLPHPATAEQAVEIRRTLAP